MNGVRLVLAFVLLAAPGLGRILLRKLSPAWTARLSAASLATGALLLEIFLVHAALPTVLHGSGLHAIARACERMGGHVLPAGSAFGWPVAGLALILPTIGVAGMLRSRSRLRRLANDPRFGHHEHHQSYDLVTLPSKRPVALSVAGDPPCVLLTEGLEGMLSPAERRVVIRHELAHLTQGHHRYGALVSMLAGSLGFLPPVDASLGVLRLALERWADETAVGDSTSERTAVRAALLKLAFWPSTQETVTAFSTAEHVNARLRALEAPTTGTGWATLAPLAVNVPTLIAAALSLATFLAHSWQLFHTGHL